MIGDSEHAGGRAANAAVTLALAEQGVRSSVLRLTPTVHDAGDNGFIPTTIAIARGKGVSAYVGDGSHRWPAVHRLDAARLFRLAIEEVPGGTSLHAVAEEGVPLREVAELIGERLGVPVESVAPEDATEHFGFLSADLPASSAITRERFGWEPTEIGLLEDLAKHYFG